MKKFTVAEVAQHNKEDDAWIIVDGKVYDITDFMDGHPGGKRILMSVAGQDATKQFHQFHKAGTVFAKYDKRLLIGVVKGQEPEEEEYPTEGPFGKLVAFGDPAWYQDWKSPYYNDSHRRLRAWARQLVETELMPFCYEWETAGQVPRSINAKLGQMGFLSCLTGVTPWPEWAPNPPPCGIKPEEWDAFHELVIGDELARIGSSGVAAAFTLGPSIALPPIIFFAPQHLKDKIIGPVLRGEKTIALAITEPYAGSDVANIQCTATLTPDGKHFIVNGEKKWITNGVWADYFVTACRTGKPGMGGISLLLIERNTPGFSTRPVHCQGNVGGGTAYVMMENVRVPRENVVGKENKGFICIMKNFNHERLGICISAIRSARVCYEEAMVYANKRRTFGKLLFEHGVIRNKLASMARQIEASHAWLEFLVYQLTVMDSQEAMIKLGGPIALLKAQSTVTLEYCAREASQILGGIAYTKGGNGEKVERIYRDVRGFAIPGGSEEVMLDLGIRQALKVSQLMGAKL
ncbi:hypothetical protein HDV05_006940 [Chytridiales sp. JEL 0842]|nr:hypothetical protein HDV05_006940 [Chytridiales sp. JEL 0842]